MLTYSVTNKETRSTRTIGNQWIKFNEIIRCKMTKRKHKIEKVLNRMSPAKVKFYEVDCSSTVYLCTGVD
jgi:hypothetical protein